MVQLWVTVSIAQGLLLTFCSEITTGEPQWIVCGARNQTMVSYTPGKSLNYYAFYLAPEKGFFCYCLFG